MRKAALSFAIVLSSLIAAGCTNPSTDKQHFVPQTVQRHTQDSVGGGPILPPPGH